MGSNKYKANNCACMLTIYKVTLTKKRSTPSYISGSVRIGFPVDGTICLQLQRVRIIGRRKRVRILQGHRPRNTTILTRRFNKLTPLATAEDRAGPMQCEIVSTTIGVQVGPECGISAGGEGLGTKARESGGPAGLYVVEVYHKRSEAISSLMFIVI